MTSLTDSDRTFGPLTWGKATWNPLRVVWSSGDEEEGNYRNDVTVYAFGWIARLWLPNILQPFRIKHTANGWDAATVQRMGRDWYYETHPREYGFNLSDGSLQLFLGAQTHDSTTTQSAYWNLPWMHWRFVRHSYYGLGGELIWTELERNRARGMDRFAEQQAAKEETPTREFEILDFDKEIITSTTLIEEREWHYGTGWFKWLSLFVPPKIRRSLDIAFSAEVGPEKGSWKGGMLGDGIDMFQGELHEQAFRRYCEREHRAKYQQFKITFVGAK
jgi:hypothetical protein